MHFSVTIFYYIVTEKGVTIFYYIVTVNYPEGVLKCLQFVLLTIYKERATGAFYVFSVIQ